MCTVGAASCANKPPKLPRKPKYFPYRPEFKSFCRDYSDGYTYCHYPKEKLFCRLAMVDKNGKVITPSECWDDTRKTTLVRNEDLDLLGDYINKLIIECKQW